MNRRHLAALVVAFSWLLASSASAQSRPNILLVITDDQGYGDLGVHGNDKIHTPNIDKLAAESVDFRRFYVMPVCSPTRACLLTGRYNYRTGVVDTFLGRSMMHSDELTLAEMLQAAGYHTGIFGKWHLGDCYPMRPIDQGFGEALVHNGGGIKQPSDPPGSSYMDPILFHNGVQKKFTGYCTDVYGDAAAKFIEAEPGKPFFCYLATNAPHTPLEVPDEWVKPYRAKGLDEVTSKIYAMCENIDRNVGRLLRKLDELKLAENTIVLYMHDNGAQQRRYNTGLRGTKGTVYEGGIRSPLFVRWTTHAQPRKVENVAAHIDLTPTLLELCGIPAPRNVKLDGVSQAELIRGAKIKAEDRPVFLQWHRGDEPVAFRNAAVVRQRFKLVEGRELYDLAADPAESKDISAEHPQVVAEMRREYEWWFADVTRERRFDPPPRIILGSPKQETVTLTRQDWRGSGAGWTPTSVGHWEVEVVQAAHYDLTLRFAPATAPTQAIVKIGAIDSTKLVAGEQTTTVSEALDRQTFRRVRLPTGPARLEAWLLRDGKKLGVEFVDVSRLAP